MPSLIYRFSLSISFLFLAAASIARGQLSDSGPESVVVVANSAMEGSLKVARAYMDRRKIPERNLIVLETSTQEHVNRTHFLETIWNPLLDAFIDRDLINAFDGQPDAIGRHTAYLFSTPIRYVVLCYGVPTKVQNVPVESVHDVAFMKRHLKGQHINLIKLFNEGNLAKNAASVDGELSLLLLRETPLNGFFPNPLFNSRRPGKSPDILRVTRLDGPSPEAVIRMIDNAIEGERKGLKGRAYVDEDGRGGPYGEGNKWMKRTAEVFRELGFDLSHNTKGSTFQVDDRMEAPVLYGGWYASNVTGPFTLPGFQFPPGAVAAHLHSYSAGVIRSTSRGWVGPLVEKGVSATFGNVDEPYLTFTHRFDLFFEALANGWNFGDAVYYALPGLSWQAVAIGDPLFRPFAVDLETQLMEAGQLENILEDQYVVCRSINRIVNDGNLDKAIELAGRAMHDTPGPTLGLLRAELLIQAGKPKKAASSLALFAELEPVSPMDWGLYAKIADTLVELKDPKRALKIYQSLERQPMPEKVQLAFLKRGISVAEKAGKAGIAIDWRARTTPPPPPSQTEPTPVTP